MIRIIQQRPLIDTETRWLFDIAAAFTIIGLVIGMAVKSYNAVVPAVSITGVLSSINSIKTDISYEYALSGNWMSADDLSDFPNFNNEDVLAKLHFTLQVRDADIIITFPSDHPYLANRILMLRKAQFIHEPRAPVIWLCGYQPVPAGMDVNPTNLTTIPASQLPSICT